MVGGTRRPIFPSFSGGLITLEGGVGADYATRFLFDKYYVKCGNTLCAICGLAKAPITLRSQMLVNEALRHIFSVDK